MERKRRPYDNERKIRFVKNLGKIITLHREHTHQTKTDFARGCGISTSFIRNIEKGVSNPTADQLDKIAEYMNLTGQELIFLMYAIDVSDDKISRENRSLWEELLANL